MRALLGLLLAAALLAAPSALADDGRGSCINHRGLTGISITVSHCVPDTDPLAETVRETLDRILGPWETFPLP